MQSLTQRIEFVLVFISSVSRLEYDLLWGPHGYREMLERMLHKRPFTGVQEAMQYLVLPIRYYAVMALKQEVANHLNAVQFTWHSQRAALAVVALASGMYAAF
jgi:hypothetical protein